MSYINGNDVLPPDLLLELQKYAGGKLLYVPKPQEKKAAWGQLSGCRAEICKRNIQISTLYREGLSVAELTQEFCLSEASIRKIIYSPS
ncbi:MAG: hypothetical protein LBM16_03790 [Clostridiales bacterium]|nr:hypothetical protein [Clostridiales bacterium]